jgi:hypothetical protein
MERNNFIKKGITFATIGLFIGLNIIPSTGIIVLRESSLPLLYSKLLDSNRKPTNSRILDIFDSSKELSVRGKIAYAWCMASCPYCEGPVYFPLDYSGNITHIACYSGPDFPAGGTWTNDGRWICCWYVSGALFEIDPETGETTEIGGGGISLKGLAYNPVNNKLYGASSDGSSGGLYEIDIKTGEQTYIGDFVNTSWMIGIAFDKDGVLYGWDISNDSLWTINIYNGEATLVGPLGIDLHYSQDGHFEMDDNILYLATYTLSPNYGGYLYKCDTDTGNCTLIGQFENNAELDALTIPYNWLGPTADFTWTPTLPNPDDTILFNASASSDPDGYITIYEWDWDNDGIFDENYTNPTAKYSWPSEGYYPVTLRITDNASLTGIKTKIVRVGNQPPDPPTITGPKYGKVGVEYEYNFSLFDPDNDVMYLRIDWGNGTPGPWHGPYNSGTTVKHNHSWNEQGGFTVRAQAKDIYNVESEWGTLDVIMPKNKMNLLQSPMLLRLLERFPNIFPIIKQLLV